MTQQEELKVLFPETSVTLSTGETIALKPFTFGQLPKALSLAGGVATLVQRAVESDNFQKEVLGVIAEGGEDLLLLIAFGIGKPRAWFDELQTDDGVLLTSEFLAVNFDFFTKRVLPKFNEGMAKLKRSPKASPNSSAEASPTAT